MEDTIKRKCPRCSEGVVESNDLDKAKWDYPALCNKCGTGFIRYNVFYWPFYPLFDVLFLFLAWAYLGTTGFFVVLVLLIVSVVTVKYAKLNQKYGPIIHSPNGKPNQQFHRSENRAPGEQ